MRKRTQKEVYEKYVKKHTNKQHEQKSNLTKSEKEGLRSLIKRINKEEIMVMKTDKSGRFIVTTPEEYVKMGEEHTGKDKEITWNEMKEHEKIISEHSIAWETI